MHVGLLATWLCAAASAAPQPPAAEPAPKPVALVELFTSEGCSSCPAAEAFLAELAQEAQEDGVPVIPVALHVTAWDALGWVDPFGLSEADARQVLYAHVLSEGRRYTPMMVVNGAAHLVGSDKPRARLEILRALAEPAPPLQVRAARPPDSSAAVAVEVHAPPGLGPGHVAAAALVQANARSAVPRGENAGRTLEHVRVARALAFEPVAEPVTRLTLAVPPDAPAAGWSVVAWIEGADRRIRTAAEVALAPATPVRSPPGP